MRKSDDNIKSVSIRMPETLLNELRYVADYEGRSINSQVLYLIRQCVNEFKDKHGDFDTD